MFGAQTIPLIIFTWLFCTGVLLSTGGIILLIACKIRKWRKRWFVLAFISLFLGLCMLAPPVMIIMENRAENKAEVQEHYVPVDEIVICHDEKIEGSWRTLFDWDGKSYIQMCPEFIDAAELSGSPDEDQLTKENAVLVLDRKRGFFDRLNGTNYKTTLFSVKSDCGYPVLSDGESCFCEESVLEEAEDYYEDLNNYSFSFQEEDENLNEHYTPIDVDPKELDDLIHSDQKPVIVEDDDDDEDYDEEDDDYVDYSLICTSKDDLFSGGFGLIHKDDTWYLEVGEQEVGEEEAMGGYLETYLPVPDSISKQLDKCI